MHCPRRLRRQRLGRGRCRRSRAAPRGMPSIGGSSLPFGTRRHGRGEHADDPRGPLVEVPRRQVQHVAELMGRVENPPVHGRAGRECRFLVEDATDRRGESRRTARRRRRRWGGFARGPLHATGRQRVSRRPAEEASFAVCRMLRNFGHHGIDPGCCQVTLVKANARPGMPWAMRPATRNTDARSHPSLAPPLLLPPVAGPDVRAPRGRRDAGRRSRDRPARRPPRKAARQRPSPGRVAANAA